MAVRLLFPTFIFHRNLLDKNLPEDRGITKEYLNLLKLEMDSMRKNDPKGRQISNAYTGWQSNDGCEKSPIFKKLMHCIQMAFYDEVWPFHGVQRKDITCFVGNSWANINDRLAWNRPHTHNGCWYSGVFYVRADGDEGDINFIDTDSKVVSDYPASSRTCTSWNFAPRSGELILFPSGLMHMVEPNITDKDRYSISFNLVHDVRGNLHGHIENYNENEFVFNLNEKGDPILN
jgi:uncharacterized protein (TIGR02466 family)